MFYHDTDKFKNVVEQVQKMEFNPATNNFVLAIASLRAISRSAWEKKAEIFKTLFV